MSKILLFSPDKDERARLRRALSELGLKVRSAASIQTARRFLEKSGFDLVLAPPEALADLHSETAAEERNRIIAEMISDYVYIFRVTENGQLIGEWISESFTRVLGLTLQDVQARGGWQHIVYPPDLPIALQHAQIVAGGQEHVAEFRFVTREGQPRWLRDHARPVFDDGGKRVTRIFGASQDITERKRHECIREAQAKIGQLLTTTSSLDEILQNILEATCNAIPAAEKGSILLTDEQGENLSIAAQWGYENKAVATARFPVTRGYAAQAFRQRKTLLIPDVQATPELHYNAGITEIGMVKSAIAVPLITHQRAIGALALDNFSRTSAFSEDDVETLTTIAASTALVIENARLQQAMQRRLNELEAINKLSNALRAAESIEQAFPILLDETLSAVGMSDGVIWLYDESSGLLHTFAARGWFREYPEKPMRPGEGIAGRVFATGQPHVSPEFSTDDLALPPSPLRPIPRGWGGACLPIFNGDKVAGVIFVSCKLPRQINADELHLLTALSDIASTTLQRMSARELTRQQIARLQAIRTIDLTIMSSVDMKLSLDVLLEQTLTHLDADAAGILLYNPTLHRLEAAAQRGFSTPAYTSTKISIENNLAGEATRQRKTILSSDQPDLPEDFRKMLRNEGLRFFAITPLIAKGKPIGVLEVFRREPLRPNRAWMDFLHTLAGQAAIAIDSARLFEDLQRSNLTLRLAYDATIGGWARALEERAREPVGHTQRAAGLTLKIARALHIQHSQLVHLKHGALLHDIGQLALPDSILLKPGPLNEEEWEQVKQHPRLAYELLHPIAYLRPALDIPYSHHERWDGSGYPQGLKGEQIPLAARIFAVVDVWDALTSNRPYRPARPREEALAYIKEQSGRLFDPQIVDIFFQLMG